MSELFPSFFEGDSKKHFHQVISLQEEPKKEWEAIKRLAPSLPRGWFELANLPVEDRVEFTYSFWQSKLLFPASNAAQIERRLDDFFESLENVEIFLTQDKKEGPFASHMVYTLKDDAGFFQGMPPAPIENIALLAQRFGQVNFPADYLAFLEIHDGFSKYTDTGMIQTRDIAQVYQRLQNILKNEILIRPDGQMINPESLIPFYESFGLHCYQCFYADWYPNDEMGNLYFSEPERSISDFLDTENGGASLAFSSFSEWLIFYLEDIWHL